MNEQSRYTDGVRHKTRNEDKENKNTENKKHTNQKRRATRTPLKIGVDAGTRKDKKSL